MNKRNTIIAWIFIFTLMLVSLNFVYAAEFGFDNSNRPGLRPVASSSSGGSGKGTNGFYLYNNTATIFFNETQLNATIDDRATGSGITNLSQLHDTLITGPSNNQTLYYTVSDKKWHNGQIDTYYLSDINFDNCAAGYIGYYTGLKFVCTSPTGLFNNFYVPRFTGGNFFANISAYAINSSIDRFCNATDCYSVQDFLIDTGGGSTSAGKNTTGFYLYNDTSTIFFNETQLNSTIDKRALDAANISFGTLAQIPFVNSAATDFDYTSNFVYNTTTGTLKVLSVPPTTDSFYTTNTGDGGQISHYYYDHTNNEWIWDLTGAGNRGFGFYRHSVQLLSFGGTGVGVLGIGVNPPSATLDAVHGRTSGEFYTQRTNGGGLGNNIALFRLRGFGGVPIFTIGDAGQVIIQLDASADQAVDLARSTLSLKAHSDGTQTGPYFNITDSSGNNKLLVDITGNLSLQKNLFVTEGCLAIGQKNCSVNSTLKAQAGDIVAKNIYANSFNGRSPTVICDSGNCLVFDGVAGKQEVVSIDEDFNIQSDKRLLTQRMIDKFDFLKQEKLKEDERQRIEKEDMSCKSQNIFSYYDVSSDSCLIDQQKECSGSTYKYWDNGVCRENIVLKCAYTNENNSFDFTDRNCKVDPKKECENRNNYYWNGDNNLCVFSLEILKEREKAECLKDRTKAWDNNLGVCINAKDLI